ncbi:hypothetical protein ES703_59792 [subsurface metagenome]
MRIVEVALKGMREPIQLPGVAVGDRGLVLKRPKGSAAMLIGSASLEINFPLTEDRDLRLYPSNARELWAVGTAGETLHLIVDEG